MDDDPPPSGGGATGADRTRDAGLVRGALDGDRQAFGRLYDLWFDRVFGLCLRIVRDREVAAEVSQDAFLAAWKNLANLHDPDAFGGWLLRIARNAALNRNQREQRSRPVDDEGLAVIESVGASPSAAPAGFGVEERLGRLEDPALVAEDGEIVDLVWQAASALGERDVEVLDLQLRQGLSPGEVGEVLGLNRNAANQLCHRIRQRFATAVRARVLWRGRTPACAELDELLRAAGVDRFDAEAVKLADAHATSCDECSQRRELRLQPAAMFASVPIAVAPIALKQQAAAALEVAGVPMDGSACASSAGASGSPRRAPRARRAALMSVAAGVVALVIVALGAVLLDDGTIEQDVAVGGGERTTTTATTEPVTTETVDDDVGEPAVAPTAIEPAPSPAPPAPTPGPTVGPASPTTTSPPSPAPVVDVWLSREEAPTRYVMDPSAPTLRWSVSGAGSVRVEGIEGGQRVVLSSDPSGSRMLCPGTTGTTMVCQSAPGTYDYDVIAVTDDGAQHRRRVTLRIPDPAVR